MKTSATITVEWGYEAHSMTLKPEDWSKVQAGEPLEVTGDGYHYEGEFFTDYWEFNLTGKGSLKVQYCSSDSESMQGMSEGFIGSIADAGIDQLHQ